jgi:hypothetical protein
VIVAPDHVADPHIRVVHRRGEVVGRGVGGLHDDEVFDVLVLERHGAANEILHDGLPLARGLHAHRERLPGLRPAPRLFGVHLAILSAGVDRLPPGGARLLPEGGEFLRGGEVPVGGAGVEELPCGLAVEIEAFGLAIGAVGTVELRTLVPLQADPTQGPL